jgi:hypothetical protein
MQIGFPGLLALIFITLKLTDYIDWSWWWVLAPIWVPLALFMCAAAFMVAIGGKIRINRKK